MSTGNENAFPPALNRTELFDLADNGYGICHGLTKREYFSALAMQGLLAQEAENWNYGHAGTLAMAAVQQADALLAELAKT